MATSPSYYGNYGDSELPTLNTVADYIADARTLLQDTIPEYRYDDQSLLMAFNVTLLDARRLRADLFVYKLGVRGQVQSFTTVDDTKVDMEGPFRLPLVYGLCGHALARDQEDVQDARSSSFLSMFYAGLVGRAMTGVAGGSPPSGRQQ
jgi:hypothetical protein